MNPWNTYRSRINAHGITKRDSVLQRERAFLSAKLPASLSYHQLTVDPLDTVDLCGKYIYQITIKDINGNIEIPKQGILFITNNINKSFIRQ